MKTNFTRRKFLKATAISATAAMLPSFAEGVSVAGKKEETAAELPKRRLGRTNIMVSCIGFGAGSRYCNWVADDATLQKQNALIGNVSGDDLLRYALTLPVTVANVGMDGFAPLESCVEVGKEPLISAKDAKRIETELNFDPKVTRLPYYTG